METKETKNCPYCGEEILAVAKKCKHCGEWLDKTSKPKTPVTNPKPIQHDNNSQISQNFQKDEAKQPPVAVQVNTYERRRKSDNESSFDKGFGGALGGCSGVLAFFVVLLFLMSSYMKSCTGSNSTSSTENSDTPSYYSSESESNSGDTESNFYDN